MQCERRHQEEGSPSPLGGFTIKSDNFLQKGILTPLSIFYFHSRGAIRRFCSAKYMAIKTKQFCSTRQRVQRDKFELKIWSALAPVERNLIGGHMCQHLKSWALASCHWQESFLDALTFPGPDLCDTLVIIDTLGNFRFKNRLPHLYVTNMVLLSWRTAWLSSSVLNQSLKRQFLTFSYASSSTLYTRVFQKTLFQNKNKHNPPRISLGVSLKGSKRIFDFDQV